MSDQTPEVVGTGEGQGLTIEQVSRLLDIPTPTIRSWERRHGVPLASRTPGGHRRYSDRQVDLLRQLRDLVAGGRRPIDAAAEVRAGDVSAPSLVEAFLQAAADLQPERLAGVLDRAEGALGLGRTVDEVLMPAMRLVGEWWEAGQHDVAHEHLATAAARGWLSRVRASDQRPADREHPIVLCCGPRDHHTLGLEAIAALLRSRGRDCRLLGARTPAESLVRAVQDTEAVAVVLVCHLPANRAAAAEALRRPELEHVAIFYAGGAFTSHQSRQGLPGHYLGTNLTRAADQVVAAVHSHR
jgi:DNA-binding transcriptional MerR regulator/methylmalonyl-CoA mutase cobalamin-binding subunit